MTPCPTVLRLLISYDPATGALKWKRRPVWMFTSLRQCRRWNSRYEGKPALDSVATTGHLHGTLLQKRLQSHRAAWAIYYGKWPDGEIDHISGEKTDNKIENLRDVTVLENSRNRPMQRDNSSGRIGVNWNVKAKQWVARISDRGSRIHIGYFDDFAEACVAREAAEKEIGFHKNHGRRSLPSDAIKSDDAKDGNNNSASPLI